VSKTKFFAVKWAEAADKDLAGIVEYVASESVIDALKILGRIKKQAEALKEFPERGRVVPELASQGIYQYREKVVAPWRLIYRIGDELVYVLAVIDSRRNLEDILLDRLMRE
jgi:plasmid stabilization system protein ParE